MNRIGEYTEGEILNQVRVWQEAYDSAAQAKSAIERRLPLDRRQILFTGCGSTYYLSIAAAAHLRGLISWPTLALPASELWLRSHWYLQPDPVLVAVSRSGTTTETVRAAELFRRATNGPLVTVSCVPGTRLSGAGDVNVLIPGGQEKSIAQTGSFAGMLVAAVTVNSVWARCYDLFSALSGLPTVGERVLPAARDLGREWGTKLEFERTYFLGSGLYYGLACEGSLKMKEMSLSHSEPFHFHEFRHGPKSMVNESTMIVGLVSESGYEHEMPVLREMAALGASVIAIGEHVDKIEGGAALSFESGLPEAARGVLYLPAMQFLAFERALAKGLNPDLPRNLDAVVVLA